MNISSLTFSEISVHFFSLHVSLAFLFSVTDTPIISHALAKSLGITLDAFCQPAFHGFVSAAFWASVNTYPFNQNGL